MTGKEIHFHKNKLASNFIACIGNCFFDGVFLNFARVKSGGNFFVLQIHFNLVHSQFIESLFNSHFAMIAGHAFYVKGDGFAGIMTTTATHQNTSKYFIKPYADKAVTYILTHWSHTLMKLLERFFNKNIKHRNLTTGAAVMLLFFGTFRCLI